MKEIELGKKRTRKAYTSKGQRPNVAKDVLKLVNRGMNLFDRELQKLAAWRKGSNPWMTIRNPNTNETNKRYIKVRSNHLIGDPKGRRQVVEAESD